MQIALTQVWEHGGKGGIELAKLVQKELRRPTNFNLLYEETDSVEKKLNVIVQQVYGGNAVQFTDEAKKKLMELKRLGWDTLSFAWLKHIIIYPTSLLFTDVRKDSPLRFETSSLS